MSYVLITCDEDLALLEPEWNRLAGGMPLCSWDWLATWWKHYGAAGRRNSDRQTPAGSERQLFVIAVYADDSDAGCPDAQLIGIAPFYLDRTIIKGNVLRWLGSGEVCTDHLSLICAPKDVSIVAAEVAEALIVQCNDWDRLDLTAIDAGDAAISRLIAEFEKRECVVTPYDADACWILDLPSSWEEYLAGISKSHRKQLRQLERRVLESDRVCWHRVTSRAEFDAAWPVLVELHQRRRRSLGEPGCFASRTFHDFHLEVSQRLLDCGYLRMSWLELDGTPAAAEYHFADGMRTYAYQGGVDPDRLTEEPGRLSTILCLKQAIDEGHAEFDFMRGDEPYKAHWRATPRPTVDYRIVPNKKLARLRGGVLNLAGAVTDWVRHTAGAISQ